VTAVVTTWRVVNTGGQPIEVALGYVPQVDVAAINFARLAEKSETVNKIVSGGGGMDRASLKKTFYTERVLGEPVLSKYWISNAQSLSSSPIDVNEPVIVYIMQPLGASATGILQYDVVYHCQFFNLETPNLS